MKNFFYSMTNPKTGLPENFLLGDLFNKISSDMKFKFNSYEYEVLDGKFVAKNIYGGLFSESIAKIVRAGEPIYLYGFKDSFDTQWKINGAINRTLYKKHGIFMLAQVNKAWKFKKGVVEETFDEEVYKELDERCKQDEETLSLLGVKTVRYLDVEPSKAEPKKKEKKEYIELKVFTKKDYKDYVSLSYGPGGFKHGDDPKEIVYITKERETKPDKSEQSDMASILSAVAYNDDSQDVWVAIVGKTKMRYFKKSVRFEVWLKDNIDKLQRIVDAISYKNLIEVLIDFPELHIDEECKADVEYLKSLYKMRNLSFSNLISKVQKFIPTFDYRSFNHIKLMITRRYTLLYDISGTDNKKNYINMFNELCAYKAMHGEIKNIKTAQDDIVQEVNDNSDSE